MATMNVIIEREMFCEMELCKVQICGQSDAELFFANSKFDTHCKYSYLGDARITNIKKFYKSVIEGFATVDGETIDNEEIERICDIAATASNM